MDKSFAQLYHDLDGGFTPLVRSTLSSSQVLDRRSALPSRSLWPVKKRAEA